MTKFVVEITLLQRCVVEADSKEEAEERFWDKQLTVSDDFIALTGEDPTVVGVKASKFDPTPLDSAQDSESK